MVVEIMRIFKFINVAIVVPNGKSFSVHLLNIFLAKPDQIHSSRNNLTDVDGVFFGETCESLAQWIPHQ